MLGLPLLFVEAFGDEARVSSHTCNQDLTLSKHCIRVTCSPDLCVRRGDISLDGAGRLSELESQRPSLAKECTASHCQLCRCV